MNENDPHEEFKRLLGGDQAAEQFLADAQQAMNQEAFMGLRELYGNLRSGGFKRGESLELLAYYLFRIGMEGTD